MTTNRYEVEINKLFAKKNPTYHSKLKNILSKFQDGLIANNIIVDSTYNSYVRLLKQMGTENQFEFEMNYDLKEALDGHGEAIGKFIPSPESSLIVKNYFNNNSSKESAFNQKVLESIDNEQKLNRATIANLIMEFYDEKDFELPLVKLKVFQFLDPNADYITTIFIGKPNLK